MVMKDEKDDGTETQYWNCPKLFIPLSIHKWYRMYQYHKEFPGANMSEVSNQNPRFLEAYYHYTSCIEEFTSKIKGNK